MRFLEFVGLPQLRRMPLLVAAVALAPGCGSDRLRGHEEEPIHTPATAEEKAAAAVFHSVAAATEANDAEAACRHAAEKAYREWRCASKPLLPRELTAPRQLGPTVVRDPSSYEADLHLSAEIPRDQRGNLVMFFKRKEGRLRVVDTVVGPYG